jgi:hypothetical protein
MKNDFCKIIFHPQTPLALNANKLLLHGTDSRIPQAYNAILAKVNYFLRRT